MKKLILALGLLLPFSAFGYAEIDIFLNYVPRQTDVYGRVLVPAQYDGKLFSTPTHILSAQYLYDSPNAACFRGNPTEGILLFNAMVTEWSLETGMPVGLAEGTRVFFDSYDTLAPALHIVGVDELGQPFPWFPRLQMCEQDIPKAARFR